MLIAAYIGNLNKLEVGCLIMLRERTIYNKSIY